jgi:hypothetical protein
VLELWDRLTEVTIRATFGGPAAENPYSSIDCSKSRRRMGKFKRCFGFVLQ